MKKNNLKNNIAGRRGSRFPGRRGGFFEIACGFIAAFGFVVFLSAHCERAHAVRLKTDEAKRRVEVEVDGRLFTSDRWNALIKRPVLLPVKTVGGAFLTRGFPIETRGGEAVTVAVFDSPANLNFPASMMVRPYGLLALNPFGRKAFDPRAEARKFVLAPQTSIEFRHRLLIMAEKAAHETLEKEYRNFIK